MSWEIGKYVQFFLLKFFSFVFVIFSYDDFSFFIVIFLIKMHIVRCMWLIYPGTKYIVVVITFSISICHNEIFHFCILIIFWLWHSYPFLFLPAITPNVVCIHFLVAMISASPSCDSPIAATLLILLGLGGLNWQKDMICTWNYVYLLAIYIYIRNGRMLFSELEDSVQNRDYVHGRLRHTTAAGRMKLS